MAKGIKLPAVLTREEARIAINAMYGPLDL